MKSTNATSIAALAAVGLALSAGAAAPSGFSGDWPLTISHSKGSNGAFCLKLTDDGSGGFPHSGPAMINTGLNGAWLSGEFQFINHLVIVAIDDVGFTENAGSTFSIDNKAGALGVGAFATIYNGEEIDDGEVVSSAKGGC